MSEQQNTTPPDESTPPPADTGSGRGSRGRASKKSEVADGGVELYRGEGKGKETVTAFKPSTITRLKSEGWMPVEDEEA
ncbi:MAG: hypothetical protein ACRDQD_00470 [Nocardioidaceae bacterium]